MDLEARGNEASVVHTSEQTIYKENLKQSQRKNSGSGGNMLLNLEDQSDSSTEDEEEMPEPFKRMDALRPDKDGQLDGKEQE